MDVCKITKSLVNHKCHVEEPLNNEFSSGGLWLNGSDTHTHAHKHVRTQARTHARTHANTCTLWAGLAFQLGRQGEIVQFRLISSQHQIFKFNTSSRWVKHYQWSGKTKWTDIALGQHSVQIASWLNTSISWYYIHIPLYQTPNYYFRLSTGIGPILDWQPPGTILCYIAINIVVVKCLVGV